MNHTTERWLGGVEDLLANICFFKFDSQCQTVSPKPLSEVYEMGGALWYSSKCTVPVEHTSNYPRQVKKLN